MVDRANILRFAAPKILQNQREIGKPPARKALSRTQWDNWRREPGAQGRDTRLIGDAIENLASVMRDLQRPIGHRMGVAIGAYVANYPDLEGNPGIAVPLADQVEMRLLPKLRGVEMEAAEVHLSKLAQTVEMLGDTELAAAIKESSERSAETGQFVWRGASRT